MKAKTARRPASRETLSAKPRGRDGFSLAPQFWENFLEHHWQKRPLMLKRPFAVPLATLEDVFRGIVKASEQFRSDERHGHTQFFIEHAELQGAIKEHLPGAADGTVENYVERITRRLNGRRFGLMVEYPGFDARTWLRLRDFLRPLYEALDIPGNPSQTQLFLGNYDKTPFGIHKDFHGTFAFIIAGRKRFRLWPDEFFSEDQEMARAVDYAPFLDDAITFEGEPGDLLYWPSTYWHIAESVGGLAVSMSVALFVEPQPALDVLRRALVRVERRLSDAAGAELPRFHSNRLRESVTKLPRVIEKTVAALSAFSQEPPLKEALQAEWLNRLTSFGFESYPPPLPGNRLEDEDIVRANPHYPIIWLPAEDDELICSANGHSFSVGAHPEIVKLLERLNRGEVCRVKQLLDEHAGIATVGDTEFEALPEDIRAVLEKLRSLRAISTDWCEW